MYTFFNNNKHCHHTLIFFFFFMMITHYAFSQSVILSFDPSPSYGVTGYKVYYGTQSRNYDHTIDIGNATQCEISGLESGTIYFVAATAYDSYDNESNYSAELVTNIPSNDTDNEGLSDSDETDIYGTDPEKGDTDGDGVSDGEEVAYWGERWNQDVDRDGIINLLDADADNDGFLNGQEINDGTNPALDESAAISFETAETTIDSSWKTISFNNPYKNPVVVAKPMSLQGADPAVIRIRSVTPNSFEMRIQEWEYLNGRHVQETVGYLVVDSGHFELPDGTQVEAGSFQTDGYVSIDFRQPFPHTPIVTAAVMSDNDTTTIAGRIEAIDPHGFSFTFQEEEASDDKHDQEIVGYIAWEPSAGQLDGLNFEVGRTQDIVTDDPHYITFNQVFSSAPICLADMQTKDGGDTSNLRFVTKDAQGIELKITEEASKDSEIWHTTEVIGYMAFGSGNSSQDLGSLD
jgi:hypothetical protein